MRHMRTSVREHNVYRWAAKLLSDLTDIRIDAPDRAEAHENVAETPVPAAMGRLKRAASS
jgi:trehalose-6-phosphate synthase